MHANPTHAAVNQSSSISAYIDLGQGGLTSLRKRLSASLQQPQPYWLTRFLILRWLGLVYFVAFLSLANQVLPLIGKDGLLPADLYLRQAERFLGSRGSAFWQLPGRRYLVVRVHLLRVAPEQLLTGCLGQELSVDTLGLPGGR